MRIAVACLLFVVPYLCVAQSDAPAAEPDDWLLDASRCKFLKPPGAPPGERITITWNRSCVDGYVEGDGELRLEYGLESPRTAIFQGQFTKGRLVKGVLEFMGGMRYEGEFRDNRLHGQGSARRPDGTTLKGPFADGRPTHGVFEMTWPDGASYKGPLNPLNGSKEGTGLLRYANGSIYEGSFKEDRLEGPGVFTHADGRIFRGTFLGGLLDGKGTIKYANGAQYEGEVRSGQENGRGTMLYSSGASYEGEFLAGRYNGEGVLKYANGDRYEGDFKAGELSGEGIHHFANGDVYRGQFLGGKQHGNGTLTLATGEVREGEWNSGALSGRCKIVRPNEFTAEGECYLGRLNGRGRFEDLRTNSVYEGMFRDGQYNGEGTLKVRGYTYQGTFKDGMKDGQGAESDESGRYTGEFMKNSHHGKGEIELRDPNGAQIRYNGEFVEGVIHGAGTMEIDKTRMQGKFKAGVFVGGMVDLPDGRRLELDLEQNTIMEVLKDGSRRSLDEMPDIGI